MWRFIQKVQVEGPDDCWPWVGSLDTDGYGLIHTSGGTRGAHRVAWELAYGPIPPGQQVDHLCRYRSCVNIRHMEVVTNRENAIRGVQARMGDRCKYGHLFDSNTKRQRVCLTCQRRRWREWKARQT